MKNIAIKTIIVLLVLVAATMGKTLNHSCNYQTSDGDWIRITSTWVDGTLVEGKKSYRVSCSSPYSYIYKASIYGSNGVVVETSARVDNGNGCWHTQTLHPTKMSERQYKKSLVKQGDGKCLNFYVTSEKLKPTYNDYYKD